MKNRIYINSLKEKIGKTVTIAGWMHRFRNMGKIAFVVLRDKTGSVQCVVEEKDIPTIKDIQVESVLKITGTVAERKDGVELHVQHIEILSAVSEPVPVSINNTDIDVHLDTLLDNKVITLRHPKVKAVFKVQAAIIDAYRNFMKEKGFTEIIFPILSGASSEGGAEFFKLPYYEKEATLSQSPQLYKQIAMGAYEGVYGVSYSFRAEKFATVRHLTEFNQLDVEFGFIDGMEDVMNLCEETVRHIVKTVSKTCAEQLDILGAEPLTVDNAFPRLTLTDALELYKNETGVDDTLEPDLSPAAEKWISTEWAMREHGTPFVFVSGYPTAKRPFYTMRSKENPNITESFDLVGNGSEIVTGGQRVHEYDMQVRQIKEHGLDPAMFEDYLTMHKYGIPPEGGFGLGVQRFTQNLLGLGNIKEATIFPRDVQRLHP